MGVVFIVEHEKEHNTRMGEEEDKISQRLRICAHYRGGGRRGMGGGGGLSVN